MEPGDERCSTCICNPDIKYKRESHPMSIKPRKEWTEEEKIKYNLDKLNGLICKHSSPGLFNKTLFNGAISLKLLILFILSFPSLHNIS